MPGGLRLDQATYKVLTLRKCFTLHSLLLHFVLCMSHILLHFVPMFVPHFAYALRVFCK